ncbi:MAG TPA: imidazole glycerol phosphate synthase subunit HisH [Alphaproteobacteria bacterium]|jgi:glutamine amidotransferase
MLRRPATIPRPGRRFVDRPAPERAQATRAVEVGVIDTGLCNLDSMVRALRECGADPRVFREAGELGRARRIILPGVGAFARAADALAAKGLDEAILRAVKERGVLLLGVCIGMQLLTTAGSEAGARKGLDLVPGRALKLVPRAAEDRIPHVGWNSVEHDGSCALLAGIPAGKDFYFVHSYHVVPDDAADVAAVTPYCGGFASVIARANVFGTQFHLEKSQRAGFAVLRNFLAMAA